MKETFDVVTGGAGFIGSHLCRALLRRGRSVRIVDDFSTGKWENLADLQQQYPGQCEISQQDIHCLEGLRKIFDRADTVYHQAAMTSVQKSTEDPLACNRVNVEGTLKVLVAARDAGVKTMIFATSTAVYGDSEVIPKREKMKAHPISPYGVSKYVGELYCRIFSEIYHLPTLGLRYFNVFGPHQDPESEYAAVIPRFISRMLAGERPIIFGDGEQSRDFVFVEDVVWANLLAAQSEVQGISLNIAYGQRITLNQLAEILNQILGQKLEPIYQSARIGDVRHSEADISQARKLIGFKPDTSFQEGLRQTVEWFQKRALTARG
ncbi:SDR family oxidoreductase [Acidobacteria bacterium AH-259-A15]|nr:SDR family oxidoreductase [Acidobacteria bacterium AH-259-A15]